MSSLSEHNNVVMPTGESRYDYVVITWDRMSPDEEPPDMRCYSVSELEDMIRYYDREVCRPRVSAVAIVDRQGTLHSHYDYYAEHPPIQ